MQPGDAVAPSEAIIIAGNPVGYENTIPSSATFVTVSGYTTNANDWIVTPTGVRRGHRVHGWSVQAHEIRTPATSNTPINGVDSDGSQEAAIPATSLWTLTYVSSTVGWILEVTSELGATVTAVVPD
jgi:hypothetical protein